MASYMSDILAEQYKRDMEYQKLRYETDKQNRIRSEHADNVKRIRGRKNKEFNEQKRHSSKTI